MARKNLGQLDEGLLQRVDVRARELGQTRRVFTERALEKALSDGAVRDGARSVAGPVDGPAASSQASGDSTPLPKTDAEMAGTPLPRIAKRRREW